MLNSETDTLRMERRVRRAARRDFGEQCAPFFRRHWWVRLWDGSVYSVHDADDPSLYNLGFELAFYADGDDGQEDD